MVKHNMKQQVPTTPTGDTPEDVDRYIGNYTSEHLTVEQMERFGPRLRELVRCVNPPSKVDARALLGATARMLSATDTGTSTVDELLSDANIAIWSNQPASKASSERTIINHVGRITQVQRAARGLPGRVRKYGSDVIHPTGFGVAELRDLSDVARAAGPTASRGFAVVFGLGVLERTSGRFVLEDGGWWLVHPAGLREPVLPVAGEVASSWGDGRVRDGDVNAFRLAARDAGFFVDDGKVRLTFWTLVMEQPIRLVEAMTNYRLTMSAIEARLRAVNPSLTLTDDDIRRLRGDGSTACAPARIAHAAARPPKSGGSEEREAVRNRTTNKSEAKRLAARFCEQAAAPVAPQPPNLQRHLDEYVPLDLTPATWEAVKATFLEAMGRSGIKGEQSLKNHRSVVAGFLGWLYELHESIELSSAFQFEKIDRYHAAALAGMDANTRNDYRSRLRNLAKNVNPGIEAPVGASAGHQAVRPGYTLAEEGAIKRVTLRQRQAEVRRRSCIAVGLAAGGGLDAIDIRHQIASGIVDRGDDGILVHVGGPRPRTVVIRREYEELVRTGMAGLRKNELVLRNHGKNTTNPVGLALDRMEINGDCPRIDVARLRSTWLTWLLNQQVPLRIVMQVAGLKSARTLGDLLPFLASDDSDIDYLRDGGLS